MTPDLSHNVEDATQHKVVIYNDAEREDDEKLVQLWLKGTPNRNTRRNYTLAAGRLLRWCADSKIPIRGLQYNDWLDFKEYTKSWMAETTYHQTVSCCAALLALAVKLRYIERSPAHVLRGEARKATRSTREVPEDVIKRLIHACVHPRDKLLLETLYAVGARASDLIGAWRDHEGGIADYLTWANVHADKGDGLARLQFLGKGGKLRTVACPKGLTERLMAFKPLGALPTDPVFTAGWRPEHRPFKPLSYNSVNRAIKEACRIAGVTQTITPHDFRHSFANHAADANAPVLDIADALGHADPKTTLAYLRHRGGTLLSADFITERD
jgi:integrase